MVASTSPQWIPHAARMILGDKSKKRGSPQLSTHIIDTWWLFHIPSLPLKKTVYLEPLCMPRYQKWRYICPIGILYITALGVLTYSLTRFFTIFCIDMETQRRRSQEFAVSTTLVKSTKHDTSKHGHLHSG